MAEIILITGGCRSGKSRYALELSEKISDKRVFVATSPNVDDELEQRISAHKSEREGRGWQTIEEELRLTQIIKEKSESVDLFLIDCLTLWVNNLLFKNNDRLEQESLKEECLKLIEMIEQYHGTVVMVTNEVGLGVVPENKLARQYRDLVGTCNQMIAAVSNKVYLVSCGIPLQLK